MAKTMQRRLSELEMRLKSLKPDEEPQDPDPSVVNHCDSGGVPLARCMSYSKTEHNDTAAQGAAVNPTASRRKFSEYSRPTLPFQIAQLTAASHSDAPASAAVSQGNRSGSVPPAMSRASSRKSLLLPTQLLAQQELAPEIEAKYKEMLKLANCLRINDQFYAGDISNLKLITDLGNGTCGHVVKMRHTTTGHVMAVKQMRRSGSRDENKRILMDLEVILKSHDCPYIVHCYGAFITDSEVWICMELMSTCLEKLLKRLREPIPERILGKMAVNIIRALHYLKEHHGVIHRDIKPSNMLLDDRGIVKLCDFGISGHLVDSKAKTRGTGCAAYMSPERIDPPDPNQPDYDVRSDVWSVGISLVELATGEYPYKNCQTDFEALTKIIKEAPPVLPSTGQFSDAFRDFISKCLTKDYTRRPKYPVLLEHPFIQWHEKTHDDVAKWYAGVKASLAVQELQTQTSATDGSSDGNSTEDTSGSSKDALNSPRESLLTRATQKGHKTFTPPPLILGPPTPHRSSVASCALASASAATTPTGTGHKPSQFFTYSRPNVASGSQSASASAAASNASAMSFRNSVASRQLVFGSGQQQSGSPGGSPISPAHSPPPATLSGPCTPLTAPSTPTIAHRHAHAYHGITQLHAPQTAPIGYVAAQYSAYAQQAAAPCCAPHSPPGQQQQQVFMVGVNRTMPLALPPQAVMRAQAQLPSQRSAHVSAVNSRNVTPSNSTNSLSGTPTRRRTNLASTSTPTAEPPPGASAGVGVGVGVGVVQSNRPSESDSPKEATTSQKPVGVRDRKVSVI